MTTLGRWYRPLAVGLTVGLLALLAYELVLTLPRMISTQGTMGVDFHQYQGHAGRWLAGGGFYLPEQLSGPYVVYDLLPPLYPPPFLLLIIPFLWLPELVWWVVPIAVVVGVVAYWRPAPWAWPLLAALVAWPRTWEIVAFGNPTMWIAAFAALGTVWDWPSIGVLLKPSLAPFALIGANRRSWWIALAVAVAIGIPFAGMWIDYAKAVLNADQGWMYSLRDVPLVAIPVVAWIAGRGSRVVEGIGVDGVVATVSDRAGTFG